MERKIKYLKIMDYGTITSSSEQGPIEEFCVNGEMAPVKWYRQGRKEYNGKYVIMIEYY